MANIRQSKNIPLAIVNTDQLPDTPGRFCMSYGFDNSALKESISQIGIINTPYIYRDNKGAIEVVTGYRRISALKELYIKEVECFDLTNAGMSLYDMFKFALHDNLFVREFNLVEKSIILNKLIAIVNDNNYINEITSLLNVSIKDYVLILKIEKMHESIKKSLSSCMLNIKSLEQLVHLSTDNQILINSWINIIKLNYNHQIQFIDYIRDISRINKISIQELLNGNYYQDLLSDTKKNIPQKAKELIDNLREKRNPDYSKYKKLFENRIRKLQLPKNIKIKHPEYFESEFYKMEIEFKDGEDLIKSLNDLINRDKLRQTGDPWLTK